MKPAPPLVSVEVRFAGMDAILFDPLKFEADCILRGGHGGWVRHAIIVSRIGAVAPIGFFGDALERRSAILDAHKLASALVALLVVAIGALKLGTGCNCAATKVVAGILGHKCSCDLS